MFGLLPVRLDAIRLCCSFPRYSRVLQIVHEVSDIDFAVESGDVDATDWLDEEAHRPFNVEKRPPFRVRVLSRGGTYVRCLCLVSRCLGCLTFDN